MKKIDDAFADKKLKQLVFKFRTAIENAMEKGEFVSDFSFSHFPCGCCGDSAYMLAQYLLENGIESVYVCGNRYFDELEEMAQSHAWLLVNELIVDITGDQFKDDSSYYNYSQRVYIGKEDAFHKLFEVEEEDMHTCYGLENYENIMCGARLLNLYRKIKNFCDTSP